MNAVRAAPAASAAHAVEPALRSARASPAVSKGAPWPSREAIPIFRCACGRSCPRCREEEGEEPAIQPKLKLSQPGDPWEREADRLAQMVVSQKPAGIERATSSPEGKLPRLSRKPNLTVTSLVEAKVQCTEDECPPKEESPDEEIKEFDGALHRKPRQGSPKTPPVSGRLNQARGRGRALPESARTSMEARFGFDFHGVRIHTDSEADRLSQDLNALAFTVGQDIFFTAQRFQPGTPGGDHLLAHELAHTIQQREKPDAPDIERLVPDTGASTSAEAGGISSFTMSPAGDYLEISPAGNPAGYNETVEFELRLTSTANPADYAIVQLVKGSMSYRDASGTVRYIPANIGGTIAPFHYHTWKVDTKDGNPEYGTTHSPPVAISSGTTDWGDEPGIGPGSVGAELPVPTRAKVWFRTGIYRRPIPATPSDFESRRPAPLAELRWAIHWRNEGSPPAIQNKPISPA